MYSEWRHVVGEKVVVRLPKSSDRTDRAASVQLITRVHTAPAYFGATAWIGPHFRPGALIEEFELHRIGGRRPVILERTKAEPLRPGWHGPAGRLRLLFILWQWHPARAEWLELGRVLDAPLDSAPELRLKAKQALEQDLWRQDEPAESAAVRIARLIDDEIHQLGLDRGHAVLALIQQEIVSRLVDRSDRQLWLPAISEWYRGDSAVSA